MPLRAVCPECDTAIRLADGFPAGKSVRCPKCQAVFSPSSGRSTAKPPPVAKSTSKVRATSRPREDDEDEFDEDDDRPRKKKRRKSSSAALWIGLGAGGVVAAIVAVVLVLVLRPRADVRPKGDAVAVNPPPALKNDPKITPPKADPKVEPPIDPVVNPKGEVKPDPVKPPPGPRAINDDDIKLLAAGLTKAEIVRLLGSEGKEIGAGDAQSAFRTSGPMMPEHVWLVQAKGATTWAVWGDNANSLYAGFGPTKKGEQRLNTTFYVVRRGAISVLQLGLTDGIDIYHRNEGDFAKIDAFAADPKWAKGPQARQLVVGQWKGPLMILELGEGGTIRTEKSVLSTLGTARSYRVKDDAILEVEALDIGRSGKLRFFPFRYWVNNDEMQLVQLPTEPNAPHIWNGPYKRQK